MSEITVTEEFETEDGGTVEIARQADVAFAELDGRIDSIKALIGCLGK